MTSEHNNALHDTQNANVILVNSDDQAIGTSNKLLAHQQGLLHRAFSIFIIRYQPHPEILLQQRAKHKYHSAGLWSNTCCSHPQPHESTTTAAATRLIKECGLQLKLQHIGSFCYHAKVSNNLIEHELDHILLGHYNNEAIHPNPAEIQALRWLSIAKLTAELNTQPEKFTPWLAPALSIVLDFLTKNHCWQLD
jgi:isopentenyl-diphosphate delta-isomerase